MRREFDIQQGDGRFQLRARLGLEGELALDRPRDAGGEQRLLLGRQGKMRIAGAVELSPEGEPRRIRLAPIGDFSARSLHAFVAGISAPGARVITDGWSGYPGLPDHDHQPKVIGATPAHLVLTGIHRVYSNLKVAGSNPAPATSPR